MMRRKIPSFRDLPLAVDGRDLLVGVGGGGGGSSRTMGSSTTVSKPVLKLFSSIDTIADPSLAPDFNDTS